jgi:hypothetical protein
MLPKYLWCLIVAYIFCVGGKGFGLTIYPDTGIARADNGSSLHFINNHQDTAYIDSLFIKADSACFLHTDNYTYDDRLCVTYFMIEPYKGGWCCITPPPNFYSHYVAFDEMFGDSIKIPPEDTSLYGLYFSWSYGGPLTKKVSISTQTASTDSYHIASIIFKSRTQGADTIEFWGWIQEGVSIGENRFVLDSEKSRNKERAQRFYTPLGRSIPSLSRYHKRGVVISSEGRILLLQ